MKTCDRGRLSKVIKIASCIVGHNLELVDVIRDQKLATLVDSPRYSHAFEEHLHLQDYPPCM